MANTTMHQIRNGRAPSRRRSNFPFFPRVRCADGTTISVQASRNHYCSPKNDEGPWTSVEIWVDGEVRPRGWVPVAEVEALIERHGGEA